MYHLTLHYRGYIYRVVFTPGTPNTQDLPGDPPELEIITSDDRRVEILDDDAYESLYWALVPLAEAAAEAQCTKDKEDYLSSFDPYYGY